MIRAHMLLWMIFAGVAFAEKGAREEELASEAGNLWKEWSHVWDGSVTNGEMAPHLAVDCSLVLDAAKAGPLAITGRLGIEDRVPSTSATSGRDKVLAAFQNWPATWSGGNVERSKFKVVGVKVTGDELTTTELVSVLVKGRQMAEYNGTWETKWQIKGEELTFQSARALTGHVARLEQETIFREGTAGILPEGAGDDLELTGENFYWRERVPTAFEPDQFGETGISVADVNGDGLEDVYLCQIGGLRNRLWLRTADGLLEESPPCGLEIRENTCAALFLDFDGDGDRDAVLTTAIGVVFFENDGRGIFTEKDRLASIDRGFGMAAADYDRDGDLDLYICQYYGASGVGEETSRGLFPQPYPVYDATTGGKNYLLRNDGGWVFKDVTDESGLNAGNVRLSFGCLWEDFDNDGDQDLFIVNDFGPNNYFENDGKGRFIDQSKAPGVRDGGFGMGLTSADFDQDGRFDLHISNMYSGAGNRIARQDWFHAGEDAKVRETFLSLARGNTLLKNLGGSTFSDISESSGIAMGRWSWASLAVDLNNDSLEDLLVANGFVTGKDPDDL